MLEQASLTERILHYRPVQMIILFKRYFFKTKTLGAIE